MSNKHCHLPGNELRTKSSACTVRPLHLYTSTCHQLCWSLLAIAVLLAATCPDVVAQSVDLPFTHRTYEFLQRMESKGYLKEYRDAIKPMPRKLLAHHLFGLHSLRSAMTAYERSEFDYLSAELSEEIRSEFQGQEQLPKDRWRPLSLPVHGGIMNVDLLGGYQTMLVGSQYASNRQAGFQVFGTVLRRVGYYFNFLSSRETGPLVSLAKLHSPEQGIAFFNTPENVGGYEYSTTEASLTYDFGNLSLAIEKTNNSWGEDRYGNVILSSKSPSFPKLRLRVSVADWMDFEYIHGELHSLVVDSSRSYVDNILNGDISFRTVYRKKYLASHALQISPWNWLDIAIGESIIYSDRNPQLMYLLPIMFFKSGEHYNRDTDNTHFFGSLDARVMSGISVYASVFIDELSVGDIFDAEKNRNWLAVSIGTRFYDLPIDNVEVFGEYTRANPWVYTHRYAATTYTNNGYALGHWIGQNADLLSVELRYRPTRSSLVGLLYQRTRNGDTLSAWHQYNPPTERFLFGRNRTESSFVVFGSYEFFRNAYAEVRYRRASLSDEQDPSASFDRRDEFVFRVRYGIW